MLIICDQLRRDAVGAYGNKHVSTPNIDFLASRGTVFSHAYSAVPSCIPARAILWTGQSQWHTGVLGMGGGQGEMPNDFRHTTAGELTGAGYQTHMVGKGHFHPQRALMGFESIELDEEQRTLLNGFKDEYREYFEHHASPGVTPDDHGVDWNCWHARPWHTEEYLHPTAWTGARAIDFLANRDQGRAFFLTVSFSKPHSPYVPPQAYWDMYINATTKPAVIGDWAEMHDDPFTAANPNAWRGRMTETQIHRARAGYYGECSFIDTQVGRIRGWLDRFDRQAYQNTWFVFVADHGDMLGDHNLWRKTYAYESSSRIPLFVVPPLSGDRPRNRTADEVVELRDIMPTVLNAAGLDIPSTVDGLNMLSLLNDTSVHWRKYLHGEHCTCYSQEQEMQFVTDGNRKFIWLPRLGQEQFFDLEEDPQECCNLIAKPGRKAEIDKWRGCLIAELESRRCGWVKDGALHCPNDEPLLSPFKDKRWDGKAC